jgi:multidrug resistance protein, MATE family
MQSVVPIPKRPGLTLEIVRLAAPIVGMNLSIALLGFTDTLFMGRISTTAVAAVGLGGLVFFTLVLLARGTVNGIVPFASQAFGAKDFKAVARALQHFLWLALISCLAIPLFWLAFPFIFALAGAEAAVTATALEFVNIRLFEIPFVLVTTVLIGFLTSLGDSRRPMLLMWAQVLLNIVFNWVLVLGNLGFPALGVRGSAIATVTATAIGAVLTVWVVFSRRKVLGLNLEWDVPKAGDLLAILRVGAPLGIMEFVEVGAFTAFLALTGRLGTAELAATQVANQISALAFMPGFGFSVAASSLVGRFVGARDIPTAIRAGYQAVWLCVAWMGMVGVGFWVFAEPMMRLFSSDANVIALGSSVLKLMAIYQVFDAANIVFRAALAGAGDTRFTAVATVISSWTLMLGGGWLLAFVFKLGLLGAWGGPFVYLTLLSFVYWWRWRSGVWTTKALLSNPA